ncbi:MAG TPA: 4-hydroxy-tetrahydrodipicolinate synthase [Candidatus Polarisedimenticolaceae bacterium]|nr:4-hydroxy-tetrahydrodipicolinate synthase [Candidatus Polarisedimenticolaceae bacterium]
MSQRLDRLQGAMTALVTPFTARGDVDRQALAALVRWQVTSGIAGLVPCGTTGEGATLSADEQNEVVATVVEAAAGHVPIVAGVGSNDTRKTVEAARRAAAAGADALLVVTPYYNKPNRSGMLAHYRAVCETAARPVVVYNVPGRTGQNLGIEQTLALAEIPGVIGIKEASGNLEQIAAILEGRPPGLAVLSGDDALALPAMALGADGLISVVSNEAPAETAALIRSCLDGEYDRARELHFRLLPLMRANFLESNPIPVKTAMELMGRCRGDLRAPLGPPEPATRAAVRQALERAGVVGVGA